jgi:hypothetical protein
MVPPEGHEHPAGKEARVKIPLTITDDRAAGLLCSALEGGSNYWYRIEKRIDGTPEPVTNAAFEEAWGRYVHAVPFRQGGKVIFSVNSGDGGDEEVNGKKQWTLNRAAVERGLALMAEKYPKHFAAILSENDDAITGDVFLQLCLFGDVVFG